MEKIRIICACGKTFKDKGYPWDFKNFKSARNQYENHIKKIAKLHGHFKDSWSFSTIKRRMPRVW